MSRPRVSSSRIRAALRSLPTARAATFAVALLGATAICLAGLWLRAPAAKVNRFLNQDVAGITYNADLLYRGMVPMRDNLEYKAPGSFFATYWVWSVSGRSLKSLFAFGIGWAIFAALGMLVAGWALYDLRTGILAGLLYAFMSPITDGLDMNYNGWMQTPYCWAFALFAWALRTGRGSLFFACGIAVTWAGLMKRQGGVIAPLFALIILIPWRPLGWLAGDHLSTVAGTLGHVRTWFRRPVGRLALYTLGGITGLLPLVIYYAAHGALGDFTQHFFFSSSGWTYVKGDISFADKLSRIGDGFLGFSAFLSLGSLLAAFSLAALLCTPRRVSQRTLLLGGFALLSFVGLALGFRFYLGYYLQMTPALVLLAAHPEGPLCRTLDLFRARVWSRRFQGLWASLLLSLVCAPAFVNDWGQLKKRQQERVQITGLHRDVDRVSAHIRTHSPTDSAIWVWGRWGWPVYYHSQRLAATPYYKNLGVITSNLTSTWKRSTAQTKFMLRGPWRELAQDLQRNRPPFIVTANNEDYRGFKPFERLLRDHYQQVPSIRGALRLWRLESASFPSAQP